MLFIFSLHSSSLLDSAAAPSNILCDDLRRLLDEPVFSDVCFLVEGKTIHVHKAVLATRCEYFQAMFSSKMDECNKVQIPIDGIAYDTFMALLEFIYTGSLSCDPAITVDLLKCKYFLRNIQPAPQMFAALNKDVFLF